MLPSAAPSACFIHYSHYFTFPLPLPHILNVNEFNDIFYVYCDFGTRQVIVLIYLTNKLFLDHNFS